MVEKPDHEWSGTKLKFETSKGEWGNEVDLKGEKGDKANDPTKDELLSLIKPLIPEPIKGDNGYTPVKGKDYFDGEDGYTPVKGKDYFDGEKGDKGDEGKKPEFKIEDIVNQTLEAIKNLKGNDRIDVSNIRNAEPAGKKKKLDMSDLRWHGGFGGVFNETPKQAVNGINATFTVTRTPFAVFVNGQFMTPGGIDYTLTGLTIVFVTAPPTGSVITVLFT
jgi:hypothetical protein